MQHSHFTQLHRGFLSVLKYKKDAVLHDSSQKTACEWM